MTIHRACALAIWAAWSLAAVTGCKKVIVPPPWAACACYGAEGQCVSGCVAAPPAISDWHQVVPGPGLPPEVVSQPANNNLDIVLHSDGQLYLAFRTAPTHFASPDAMLYVVSTSDEQQWRFEASYHMELDLREPRFLSFDGRLFLYYAVLGDNPIDFEPQGMMVSERLGPGRWSEPEWFYDPGFIPWRTKTISGVPYMLTYVGGENIYDIIDPEPVRVHWLTTSDGYRWEPVVPGQPLVLEGGVSETDFVFTDDGALIAVARNELGDADGWGSKICRAEPGALGDWSCVIDPKKYDSPLVFKHGSEVYLIGRRHLTADGNYDLFMRQLSPAEQTNQYNQAYWVQPKRCSLWHVDQQSLQVSFVLDLPSAGDTCFAGLVPLGDGHYHVYNYTSDPANADLFWVQGQQQPTLIYWLTLAL